VLAAVSPVAVVDAAAALKSGHSCLIDVLPLLLLLLIVRAVLRPAVSVASRCVSSVDQYVAISM
jgi:hypothetical protein